jgi:lipopolysaccharide export LptBFGC system permease protein LptF
LLTGILLGLGFLLSNRIFGQIAMLQDWPAAIPALLPIAVFGMAAFAALWWIERR